MGRRRRGRETVLRVLYAFTISGNPIEEVLDDLLTLTGADAELDAFVRRLVGKIAAEEAELDQIIAHRAKNWDLERIALIDKLILRIGLCELLYFPEVPGKVCINESIELTKKYSSFDAKRFVNGILDSVYKERQPERV